MAAVVLTKEQTQKLIRIIARRGPLEDVIESAVLRTYKDANGVSYKLEFMTLDVSGHKDLVEPLLPKEIG